MRHTNEDEHPKDEDSPDHLEYDGRNSLSNPFLCSPPDFLENGASIEAKIV
jgi:hypothetical protein